MSRAVYFISILFLLNKLLAAANYYVDNFHGSDLNDGKTPSAAWQSISKVNETSFQPGDRINFIRGGIWSETLMINSSGSASANIMFTSYGQGNLPQIDGGDSLNSCIEIHSQSYVTIAEFWLKNNVGNGSIHIMYSNYVYAEGNVIYTKGKGGVFIENSSYCLVKGNSISTPDGNFPAETDGIYSQRNSGNIYEKNKIIIGNSHPDYHIDGIQSYLDNDITIRNSYVVQDNQKPGAQGIYFTNTGGRNFIYNNVVDCPYSVSSVIGFISMRDNCSLDLVHNTVIGKGGNIIYISGNPAFTIKDNIFKAVNPNYSIVKIDSIMGRLYMDYNLFYNGGNPQIIVLDGNTLTWEQWSSLGYDIHSIIADPMLNPDYTLNILSPAIDTGTQMGILYRFDKKGTERPQIRGIDIGAYETMESIQSADSVQRVYSYELYQNYPNPFNPRTVINYSIPQAAHINLEVFNVLGEKISTLVSEYQTPGMHTADFNGTSFPSGIYFYRLQAEQYTEIKKMTLSK